MRIIIAAALAATTLTALPAMAQSDINQEARDRAQDARRDYRHDLRNADDPGDVRRARRDYTNDLRDIRRDHRADLRDWRQYRNYDYNRPPRGQRGYYADNYYRDGRYYQQRALTRNDRIYRGNNGRYYCRRSDGTTGLIVGGLAGGALGNIIAPGGSKLLGTLLGAGAGGLVGNSVDRGSVTCR